MFEAQQLPNHVLAAASLPKHVHPTELFTELAGQPGEQAADACDSSPAGRSQLLMLAPVATAYDRGLAGSDDGRRVSHPPRA